MNHFRSFLSVTMIAGSIFAATAAHADTITPIQTPYNTTGLWPNWTAVLFNGPSIAASPKSGNQGSGLNFADWSGQFFQVNQGGNVSVGGLDIALTGNSSVSTLINLFYGSANPEATVVFTNSNGDTASYTLVGDQTVRDFNQSTWANGTVGSNADPTLGAVTTQTWFDNGEGQRLDAQTYILPSSWGGTDLTGMTITNISPVSQDDVILSAALVDVAPTPEPSSLALLGTGVLAMAGAMRRRFAAARL